MISLQPSTAATIHSSSQETATRRKKKRRKHGLKHEKAKQAKKNKGQATSQQPAAKKARNS